MTTVEVICYKLRENVKTNDFLKAAEKMIPELKTQQGLIDRQLCNFHHYNNNLASI